MTTDQLKICSSFVSIGCDLMYTCRVVSNNVVVYPMLNAKKKKLHEVYSALNAKTLHAVHLQLVWNKLICHFHVFPLIHIDFNINFSLLDYWPLGSDYRCLFSL